MTELFDNIIDVPQLPSNTIVIGADEVGRGCLFGPVVGAAVMLDPANPISGLNDSKKLNDKRRQELAKEIKEKAIAYSIVEGSVELIDKINILQASLYVMSEAVNRIFSGLKDNLKFTEKSSQIHCLVDGNQLLNTEIPCTYVVKGDSKIAQISAASILAKVYRDDLMNKYSQNPLFSCYHLHSHKGYPTKLHLEFLRQHGVSKLHRKSFAPVKKLIEE